jgi:probable phosphoglycerate mutase
VVIWRHGQTAWNVEGRFQGQTDVDLDDVGRSQAARSAALLAALRPTSVVSSDLRRAEATARVLAGITGLPWLSIRGCARPMAGYGRG